VNDLVDLRELGERPGYFLVVVPPSPEELRRTHKLLDQILAVLSDINKELAEIRALSGTRLE
jgi:type II secretory pathway component PulM